MRLVPVTAGALADMTQPLSRYGKIDIVISKRFC
jgi:hypothetical protein